MVRACRFPFAHECVATLICLFTLGATSCKQVESKAVAYHQMRVVGDDFLLVGHVPDTVSGYRLLGQVALVNKQGKLGKTIRERAVFAVEALTDNHIWLSRRATDRNLTAHALPSLTPIAGTKEALMGHPVLSNGYEPVGSSSGKPILEGGDGKLYSIDVSGNIAPHESLADVQKESRNGDKVAIPFTPVRAQRGGFEKKLSEALTSPLLYSESAALLGDASGDHLVRSTQFQVGKQAELLSRVGSDGAIRWSKSIPELAGPITIDNAQTAVVSIVRSKGELWMLLRSDHVGKSNDKEYYDVEHKLVRLDATTGKILASVKVES